MDIDAIAWDVWSWAEAAFPQRTDASMFLKMYSELAETIRSNGAADEVADLFILLLDYAKRKDINLTDAIKHKLNVNRCRTWQIDAIGTMSHVK